MQAAGYKRCPLCDEEKPLVDFSLSSRHNDGRQGYCRACARRRAAEYYAENRERILQRIRSGRSTRPFYAAQRAVATAARHRKRERQRLARPAPRRPLTDEERRERKQRRNLGYHELLKLWRATIYHRDNGRCGICGGEVDPDSFHLDHIIPFSRGGVHDPGNIQLAHPLCNLKKGAREPVAA
jgi:5-methylcytosine-specific restriction endonuclease McrA